VPEDVVAPVKDCAGALGRVKGPLAELAANAPLTRPARSRLSAINGATGRSDQREVARLERSVPLAKMSAMRTSWYTPSRAPEHLKDRRLFVD
jgi:hypothetical protein